MSSIVKLYLKYNKYLQWNDKYYNRNNKVILYHTSVIFGEEENELRLSPVSPLLYDCSCLPSHLFRQLETNSKIQVHSQWLYSKWRSLGLDSIILYHIWTFFNYLISVPRKILIKTVASKRQTLGPFQFDTADFTV